MVPTTLTPILKLVIVSLIAVFVVLVLLLPPLVYWLVYGFLVYGLVGIWVFDDGRRRGIVNAIGWALGTLLLGTLLLPAYVGARPLAAGEVRKGGTAWNILKHFTIYCVVVAAVEIAITVRTSTYNRWVGAHWFFPAVGALVLGFLLKNSTVEKGPTAPSGAEGIPRQHPFGGFLS